MVGDWLTQRYQGAGAFVYAGLLGLAFQNPLLRATATPRLRAWRERVNARWKSLNGPMRALLLLGLSLAVLFLVPWQLTVSGDFSVAPRHNADVRAEVDGIIAQVYVDEGQRVAAGELIVRLLDRDYRAELRALVGKIDVTIARRAGLREASRGD